MGVRHLTAGALLAPRMRGSLLDLAALLATLGPTAWLGHQIARWSANAGSHRGAAAMLVLILLGMLVLPPVGASLKRWHLHQRLAQEREGLRRAGREQLFVGVRPGCLFHPVFHFVLTYVLAAAAMAFVGEAIFGTDFHQTNGARFLSLLGLVLAVSIGQTILVYRYFSPPARAPAHAFLRSPNSELLGDACLYVNMALYQVLWSAMSQTPFGPVTGVEDAAGRLFFLAFASLLVYLPPRMFYLAEDLRRPFAWLTLLLANGAVIASVFFGVRW